MRIFTSLLVLLTLACSSSCGRNNSAPGGPPRTIRVAVIGGMAETGFWQALSKRFEDASDHCYQIKIVISGPKVPIADAFKQGQADLITMHSSDTIINLAADGYALDPQPWLKNDLVIVGPPDDPAHISTSSTAVAAFARIIKTRSPFVVHSSLGAQEVMRDILQTYGLEMPSDQLTILFTDRARDVLKVAAEKHAYTLVGRIPFRSGKLPNAGLKLFVQGDPMLRRPYLVETANPARFPEAHIEIAGAKALGAFLRTPETQKWIATYGVGQIDEQPLFFPVAP